MKLLIYLGKDFIMDEILNMNINEMANVSFHCSCGKTHHLDIRKIVIGNNVISELPSILEDFSLKKSISYVIIILGRLLVKRFIIR